MEIKERKLNGTFEIILKSHIDERGFFVRTFDNKLFKDAGIDREWVQENHAQSEKKNIIRGLHFQFPPFSETKLIRSVSGTILDVFVDLRKDSLTFGQWDSIELSAENKKMILIPRGFAHGYRTITEVSEVLYKVDNYYMPEYEGGIIWNDKDLNVDWELNYEITPILSEKDSKNMTFAEFRNNHGNIDPEK